MLTTFNEIDMSNVMQMRTEYKDVFRETRRQVGLLSTFLRRRQGVAEEPSVNAIIDGDEIVQKLSISPSR